MAIQFTPVAAGTTGAFEPWEPGVYDFTIQEARETDSRQGNPMIELRLKIMRPDGRERTVFDYLVFTEGMQYRIRHCFEAIGLDALYESGDVSAGGMVGASGRCEIHIEEYNGKRNNKVRNYIGHSAASAAPVPGAVAAPTPVPAPVPGSTGDEDDIPF